MGEPENTVGAMTTMMANNHTNELKSAGAHAMPMNIATISAGFEKGDFLVREEQGNRVYFDFFEEVSSETVVESRDCVV